MEEDNDDDDGMMMLQQYAMVPKTFFNYIIIKNRRQARKGRFCSEVCGTKAFLGGLKGEHKKKGYSWMDNQHFVMWCGPCSTQRQARELISGPDLATRA